MQLVRREWLERLVAPASDEEVALIRAGIQMLDRLVGAGGQRPSVLEMIHATVAQADVAKDTKEEPIMRFDSEGEASQEAE